MIEFSSVVLSAPSPYHQIMEINLITIYVLTTPHIINNNNKMFNGPLTRKKPFTHSLTIFVHITQYYTNNFLHLLWSLHSILT